MKQSVYFDRFHKSTFVAIMEDKKLISFEYEEDESAEIVGNIYKGKVVNVLSGMNAAFVYCGLDKNCYLSGNDLTSWEKEGELTVPVQNELTIKEGDDLLVQVIKSPRGNKGAKISTKISMIGKYVIYVPGSHFVGVSHKIEDEELKEHLQRLVTELSHGEGGFVVRTAAPYVSPQAIGKEIEELKLRYEKVCERAKVAKSGDCVFEDGCLPAKVIRNLIADDVDKIYVGDEGFYREMLAQTSELNVSLSKKIVFYQGERDMFYSEGISQQAINLFSPRVDLANGAYLIIEKTEALTVIDVNSGKYIGQNNLEETSFTTNLYAAREIASQVKLRNIGGIVVVDFIDMSEESHRKQVVDELTFYLSQDRARINVLPMSDLGLVEFTRKRSSNEAVESLKRPCPYCAGMGEIFKPVMTMIRIRRDIMDCFADGYHTAIVELNEFIMKEILSKGMFTGYLNTIWKGKKIYFVPHKTYHEQQYTVQGDNAKVLNLSNKAQICY